jgi:Fe2+ or Zn2+ uptake regulation protein
MRTFIVGSSHVNRLQKYIERGHDFRLENHSISIEGISGGNSSESINSNQGKVTK